MTSPKTTVILGLGANLGNKLETFVRAAKSLSDTGIISELSLSALYESEALMLPDSPASWNIPFYNIGVRGKTTLSPQDLLKKVKALEVQLGRTPRGIWAPREIDIDILCYGTKIIDDKDLTIPHVGLLDRPFALWPFAALAPEWPCPADSEHKGMKAKDLARRWGRIAGFTQKTRTRLAHCREQAKYQELLKEINLSPVPECALGSELVGVLNITPDSFSDGGQFISPLRAKVQAEKLFNEGANIIDIGAESTRPGAKEISAEQEWQRLEPVLSELKYVQDSGKFLPFISLDTRNPETALKADKFGVSYVNDVSGLSNPEMLEVLADLDCEIFVMHNLGIPPHKDKILLEEPVPALQKWIEFTLERTRKSGIAPERLIFDPGIGFGKSAAQSWEIIQNISELKKLGIRLLIGHSRKSFLDLENKIPANQRDLETSVISVFLNQAGADYLRVHDISSHVRVLKTSEKLYKPELFSFVTPTKNAIADKLNTSEDEDLMSVIEEYSAGPDTGIFTDGGASPNPGHGGWGVVYVKNGKIIKELSGDEPDTTNNRMELTALINAYQLIDESEEITIYSDSNLCVQTINTWAKNWEKRGWKKKDGEIKNLELVQELYALAKARPKAKLQWVKAHDGTRWNEYADALSVKWRR